MHTFTQIFIDRFWSNVDIQSEDECWIWKKFKNAHGYGRVGYTDREVDITLSTHRVSYELTYGPFDESLNVCHKCDNPSCCNPYHLFLGTQKDNVHDMDNKNRRNNVKGEGVNTNVLTEIEVIEIRNRYYNEKISYGKLAKEYGVHKSTIAYLIRGQNWKHLDRPEDKYTDFRFACTPLTEENIIEIRNSYAEGLFSQKELSEKYHVHIETIRNLLRGETWADMGGPITIKPRNKINYDIAEEIRQLHQEGKSIKELSSLYNLSVGSIGEIIKYQRWKGENPK